MARRQGHRPQPLCKALLQRRHLHRAKEHRQHNGLQHLNLTMIEIKELTKVYRDAPALDRVSLKIEEGELFSFLGPNGAGKTTLMLILSTLLRPTSGTAFVDGHDVLREPERVKREVGVLFQETSLDGRLTGRENLEVQAVLYDVPKEERRERIDEMLDFVGLLDWADEPVERYSGGMQRRLEIARALIHRPRILLLDEPTLGLDPKAREAVWTHIKRLEEMTTVLTTNYIEEAEALSQRVAIMDTGRIVALGPPEELKASLGRDVAHVTCSDPEGLRDLLSGLGYVGDVQVDGRRLSFTIEAGRRKELLEALSDYELESMEVRGPTLSDVFRSHTGRSIHVPFSQQRTGRRRLGRKRRRMG
ncbi:MAG: ATP-binding cassette domain-containing protein [Methanobacteriota archaeon]|nr:MAG: ATP-binding cassette domain-containing protein [Euryarchaeota archaeon]